ncbi:MAG: glycogen/starch synthase, partial [Lachnospiraceae bacterium]|nr:glycogen/starch synthase [Lachnospiraceae bacterium]
MKKILFIASEGVPFIKTGGLADVVGSLPECFDKRYFDVRVLMPKYMCMYQDKKDLMEYVDSFYMDFAGRREYVGILQAKVNGIQYYFIDNEHYFAGDAPYGDLRFDLEKFIYFDKAALSALPIIGFKPDIIHCHDWQTGLVPVYLKDSFREGEFFRDI